MCGYVVRATSVRSVQPTKLFSDINAAKMDCRQLVHRTGLDMWEIFLRKIVREGYIGSVDRDPPIANLPVPSTLKRQRLHGKPQRTGACLDLTDRTMLILLLQAFQSCLSTGDSCLQGVE